MFLPGGSLSRGISLPGVVSGRGVSLSRGEPVCGEVCRETRLESKMGGTHPTGMLSCLIRVFYLTALWMEKQVSKFADLFFHIYVFYEWITLLCYFHS